MSLKKPNIRTWLAASAALTLSLAAHAQLMTVHSDAETLLPIGTKLGATAADREVGVSIVLPSRDPAGLAGFVASVTNPRDKLYRHYLTPADFARRFGANTADYDALAAWAANQGLTIGEAFAAHTVLKLKGPASAVASAFNVVFHDYTDTRGRIFYAADSTPALPAVLAQKVQAVLGLRGDPAFHPLVHVAAPGPLFKKLGRGPAGGYDAEDLRMAYDLPPQTFPQRSQAVALFEQGGFYQSDIDTYRAYNHLDRVPVIDRNVDGYSGAVDDPSVDLEATLDIDMVLATNPQVGRVIVYEDGNIPFSPALLDSLEAMAGDNRAQTVSISYGFDEAMAGNAAIQAEAVVLQQLAAQGQQVFVSSGDRGAFGFGYPNLSVYDPASQPLVTSVGGTHLVAHHGTYRAETVWNDFDLGGCAIDPLCKGASGGGISTAWLLPGYQTTVGYVGNPPYYDHQFSLVSRNVPDVAAVGDEYTGVDVYAALFNGWLTVGGTSVGAPVWAGFFSVANDASEGFGLGRIGSASYSLYYLSQGSLSAFELASIDYADFHDVIHGNNGLAGVSKGFSAVPFYDNVTGLGSMQGGGLSVDLALATISGRGESLLTVGVPKLQATSTSITATWQPVTGARGYYVSISTYDPKNPFGLPGFISARLTAGTRMTFENLTPGSFYSVRTFVFDGTGTAPAQFPAIAKTRP